MTIQDVFTKHGFPYSTGLIMAFIGGSTQHGAKLTETSDTDYYGIFIPPPEKLMGLDPYDSFVFPGDVSHRTRGIRNPDELDISLHSLQKWAGMAAKGNPTVLSFFFATVVYPEANWRPAWESIKAGKSLFLAKTHCIPFVKYAAEQMQRLLGLRGQKNVNRDHLVDQFGYDTKYAMHIIRLLTEAKELMETGRISYPNISVEVLKDIRRGKYKLTEIHEMGEQLRAEALAAQEKSSLPDKVDRAAISQLIAEVHMEFYNG